MLLWRGLYSVFHLSSYYPYLVPLLLAEVGVMHVAWRLCRRAGTDPWLATAAVGLLGFLGAGAADLGSAFQIGFVGSVLFGLLAIDLLDVPARAPRQDDQAEAVDGTRRLRRAPTGRLKDALASAALLASLMCSTIGDAMVVGAAVVVSPADPRGAPVGVLALPVASYLVWFSFLGWPGVSAPADHFALSTFTGLPGYVWYGLSSGLGQTFNEPDLGGALLVGLAAWLVWNMRTLWLGSPALLGLGATAVAFYVLAGLGRDQTPGSTTVVSRYVYVAVAVLVPVAGKLLTAAGTWWLAVGGAGRPAGADSPRGRGPGSGVGGKRGGAGFQPEGLARGDCPVAGFGRP